MNAKQRRKLRRIHIGSTAGQPSRAAIRFVVAHCPPPKRICVMNADEAERFRDVSIAHRCPSTRHRHYTRKHVDRLVKRGEVRWVGLHRKVAAWTQHRTWQKVASKAPAEMIKPGVGTMAVMQLVPGSR